jgi:hypothetical protein
MNCNGDDSANLQLKATNAGHLRFGLSALAACSLLLLRRFSWLCLLLRVM